MAYLPQAQQTKWQQSNEIDLTRTAVLVIDVLGGEEGGDVRYFIIPRRLTAFVGERLLSGAASMASRSV